LDVLKGVASGWIVMWLYPGNVWLQVVAAILAVLGHNYSVFLMERNEKGQLRLRGGAGGATAVGGAIALWPSSIFFILPVAVLVFLLIGYASVTTISVTVAAIVIFTYRAARGISPTEYIAYGVMALLVVLYALRPNLVRLAQGTERPVGLRAYRMKKQGLDISEGAVKKIREVRKRTSQRHRSKASFPKNSLKESRSDREK
jgi:glycerol-3-phosphate acyltransferase PlsY